MFCKDNNNMTKGHRVTKHLMTIMTWLTLLQITRAFVTDKSCLTKNDNKSMATTTTATTITTTATFNNQYYSRRSLLLVRRNLFWFGGGKKDGNDENDKDDDPNELSAMMGMENMQPGSMGGTASMMENFKQSQDLGKRTSALVQDLSSSTIEGTAADGKVRVFVDGQQRPIGVDIDPDYISNISSVEDLNEAITLAMQEANSKSMQQMQEKMSNLYTDLGIPTNKAV